MFAQSGLLRDQQGLEIAGPVPLGLPRAVDDRVSIASDHRPSETAANDDYDRRGRRRTHFLADVRVQVDGQPFEGHAQNLSTGGIGLRIDAPLEEGTAVTVEFAVPGAGAMAMEAVVSWSEHGRAGLRFTRLNPVSLSKLMSCIAD